MKKKQREEMNNLVFKKKKSYLSPTGTVAEVEVKTL